LPNADDAFKNIKTKMTTKLFFNHLNFNWNFILAYFGDEALKLKNMIKSDTFFMDVLNIDP
jgi:hypothetical protein